MFIHWLGYFINTFVTNDEYSSILLWLMPDDFTCQGRSPVAKVLKNIFLRILYYFTLANAGRFYSKGDIQSR